MTMLQWAFIALLVLWFVTLWAVVVGMTRRRDEYRRWHKFYEAMERLRESERQKEGDA